jgi:uncharacterized GH25 family protein
LAKTSHYLTGRPLAAPFFIAIFLLYFAAATEVSAHDFWIEPSSFRPAPGARVALALRVGESWKGEPVPYQADRVVLFTSSTSRSKNDLEGFLPIERPGLHVVAYQGKHNEIRFEDFALFEKYLREEGLEHARERSRRLFEAKKSLLEHYTRYAKTLVGAGGGAGTADRVAGLPFELIPENNPYAGERTMTVRLLYRGKPLAGVLAIASRKESPAEKLRVRTGKDGRASFQLERAGVWLINAVHLVPAAPASGADWESFWASLTFERPDLPSR